MKVVVALPEPVWGRLASIADARGVSVADVIGKAIAAEMKPRPLLHSVSFKRRQVVVSLVEAGHTDRFIAEATGELVQYVRDARRDAGLPANKARISERKSA